MYIYAISLPKIDINNVNNSFVISVMSTSKVFKMFNKSHKHLANAFCFWI